MRGYADDASSSISSSFNECIEWSLPRGSRGSEHEDERYFRVKDRVYPLVNLIIGLSDS